MIWLVVLGFNATLTAKVISQWLVTHMFPGFLTPVLKQLYFPKPLTTFLTCICRGKRQKYFGMKVCLNQGSNSQPPGHESDRLATILHKASSMRGINPVTIAIINSQIKQDVFVKH